jgi:hypothetical protein
MYSKIYTIKCSPDNAAAMMAYYDESVAGVIQGSPDHVGHQMIETSDGSWLLVSNYTSKQAAEAFGPRVQEIVAPMIADFGMSISVLDEGETVRDIK